MPTTSRGPAGRASASGPSSSRRRPARSSSSSRSGGTSDGGTGKRTPSSGSRPAARPTPAADDAATPARSSVTTRAAVLLSVLAVLAASYAFPLRAWLDQRGQLAELSEQRDALTEEVADLEASRELWDDPAYVRAQARERLNYVLPGEVGIVVLGTESTPPDEPVTGTLVPAATDGQEWWSTLVSAFVAVGTGPPGEAASDPPGSAPADDADAGQGSSSGATPEEATESGGTAQSAEDAGGDPGSDPGGDSAGGSAGGADGGAGAGSP